MRLDARKLAAGLGLEAGLPIHRDLCRGQLDTVRQALAGAGPLLVACTQEAPLFAEIATDVASAADVRFTNVRERAGWTGSKGDASAKIAALLAEASVEITPTRSLTLKSNGRCLVYGPGQTALDAAAKLAGKLSVTVLLTETGGAVPPSTAAAAIVKGRIRSCRGHLGAFELEVDGYAAAVPSSRRKLEFEMARNSARTSCDVIIDLSGGNALFDEHARRDGYLRANPDRPADIAEALFKAADFVGEFEKPIYVAFDAGICAHSRSGKSGCRRCLDVCPTGAITSSGDHVAIDAAVCAGCGNCAAVCPTDAARYDYPANPDTLARLSAMLAAYVRAGGSDPIVLIHDEGHGRPLIDVLARERDGLPVNVLPFAPHAATNLGPELLSAIIALGACEIIILCSEQNRGELASLGDQIALTKAFLTGLGYEGSRLEMLVTDDPDQLAAALDGRGSVPVIGPLEFAISGTKRDLGRTVLSALHAKAPKQGEWLPLPKGAPYGRINVAKDACTLCLACVGACPANALQDNPDRPELSFVGAACVQCGICVATCPENAITLEPGYDFSARAMTPSVQKSEQPFHCVSCGKPFGTKSSIERVIARLKGRNPMFETEEQLEILRMCDNCRVVALAERSGDPMRFGTVPRVRTTADYVSGENAGEDVPAEPKRPKNPDDFLN